MNLKNHPLLFQNGTGSPTKFHILLLIVGSIFITVLSVPMGIVMFFRGQRKEAIKMMVLGPQLFVHWTRSLLRQKPAS